MSRIDLLNQQRAWANENALLVDERGYLFQLTENLFRPLSSIAQQGFLNGSGSEHRDGKRRPAKMKALHSSAVLAVNVFDYWTEQSPKPLLESLGLAFTSASLRFEEKFATGLQGIPPNLDVAIELDAGQVIGIESKFTEWLARKSPHNEYFKAKYLPDDSQLWLSKGLAGCQVLANAIGAGTQRFQYLDANQLLKHALGLATQRSRNFQLYYIFFDTAGPESSKHREEIANFKIQIGEDFSFKWSSYQETFSALMHFCSNNHQEYINYLFRRYFKAAN